MRVLRWLNGWRAEEWPDGWRLSVHGALILHRATLDEVTARLIAEGVDPVADVLGD